jgi:hypothetical protein
MNPCQVFWIKTEEAISRLWWTCKIGEKWVQLDLAQIRMHVVLTEASYLCRVPNKGTMTSPSSLDLYCISSLNHNAPMNNDSTEHSLKCDDQELGSSKPLSGAYFSPLVWIILVAVLARSTCLKAFIDRYRRIALRSSCRFNPMTLRKQMRVGTRCKVNIPVPVVEFV